jgi:ankyrin repeat protein
MSFRYISLLLGLLATLAGSAAWAKDANHDKELRLAASIGDDEAIAKLIDRGADVNAANKFDKTALMMAVEGDNLDTVALLLARGADVNARTVASCTALTFAAENGHIGITALLIESGANVHDRTRAGWDALMIASRYGIVDMIEQLLYRGADPKAADKDGHTAWTNPIFLTDSKKENFS